MLAFAVVVVKGLVHIGIGFSAADPSCGAGDPEGVTA